MSDYEWKCKCGKWYSMRTAIKRTDKSKGKLAGVFTFVNIYCPYCKRSHKGNVTLGRDKDTGRIWKPTGDKK